MNLPVDLRPPVYGKPARLVLSIAILAILAVSAVIAGTTINIALATQPKEERDVLSGKEHQFGDAFIVALGGKLYDDFWAVTSASPPADRNPQFPQDVDATVPDTWRCVSCHGWDYVGAPSGNSKELQAVFKSLRHLSGRNPFELVELFKKTHPNYAPQALEELPLSLLMLFVSVGQYDRDRFLPPTPASQESLKRGQDIFEGVCMNCHNPDGTAQLKGAPKIRSSLGWLARNRPERMLHKVLNGAPGESMLAMRFLPEDVIVDLLAYLRTLDPDN